MNIVHINTVYNPEPKFRIIDLCQLAIMWQRSLSGDRRTLSVVLAVSFNFAHHPTPPNIVWRVKPENSVQKGPPSIFSWS